MWAPLNPLRPLAGTGTFQTVAQMVYPLSMGSSLGEMNTYSYKTPDAHLASVRNFNKGLVGVQQHVWQATLDADALLWGTHPGPRAGDHAMTYWTGGSSLPRVDQHESVLLALYNPTVQGHLGLLFLNFTHAFFPTERFDAVEQQGGWIFANKGEGYLGVWAPDLALLDEAGNEWSGQELRSPGVQSAWIVEIGRAATDGSFADFQRTLLSHTVELRTTPPVVDGPSGIVTCLAQHPECLEGFPGDLSNLLACVQYVPVVNPRPVCGDKVDVSRLLGCINSCEPEEEEGEGETTTRALCLAQCAIQHATIEPGSVRSGDIVVDYVSHRTETRYEFSWDFDMRLFSTRDGQLVPRDHNLDSTKRYNTPYTSMQY